MKSSLILPSYIGWHYTDAIRNIWGIFTNFIWFLYHFFSVPILLKTLFDPWQKLGEKYKKGLGHGTSFLLRVLGFAIRITVLGLAFMLMVGVFCVTIVFYVLWIFLPIILFLLYLAAVQFFSL